MKKHKGNSLVMAGSYDLADPYELADCNCEQPLASADAIVTTIDNVFEALKREDHPACGKKPIFNFGGKKDDWQKCVKDYFDKNTKPEDVEVGSDTTWWFRNKQWVIPSGIGVAAIGIYFATRK